MNVKDLQTEAARLNIKGRSKMVKDELVGAILAHPDSRITTNRRGDLTYKTDLEPDADSPERVPATHQELEEVADPKPEPSKLVPNRRDLRRAGYRRTKARKVKATGVMGLHFRGRALGLKHYQAMGLAVGRTNAPTQRNLAPVPNSERVQKYTRQNATNGTLVKHLGQTKLTHRQMRRVLKHHTPADGLRIWPGDHAPEFHSLVGRTLEGLSIFYKFAN